MLKRMIWMAAVLSTAGASAATVDMADLPVRRAGLWEVSLEKSTTPGKPTVMEQCVGDKTDASMRDAFMQSDMCEKRSFKKTSSGWEGDSICTFGNSKITSHVVVTGDFQSAYQIDTQSRYDPPMAKLSELTTKARVSYKGACKAGMQPGDVTANGMTLHMGGNGKGGGKMSQEEIKQMIEQAKKLKHQGP